MIEANVIDAAYKSNVTRLLFLGSTCIYPKAVAQPMREDSLLTEVLEPTNEPYAVAKIAGIKLCESYNRQYGTDFRSVMPTNLYGPGDNYHSINSHVLPSLINIGIIKSSTDRLFSEMTNQDLLNNYYQFFFLAILEDYQHLHTQEEKPFH